MNITTKICLGATILFSIVGIVIGFSKKSTMSDLEKKYEEAKGAKQALASKNAKILNLEGEVKALTGQKQTAESSLNSAQQDANQARSDKQTAETALTTAQKDRDDFKDQLDSVNQLLNGAKTDARTLTLDRDSWKKKYEDLKKKRNGRPRGPANPGTNNPKPATPGTQGKVVVNNANQFVIIDIGQNKGLVRGSVLEVWDGATFIGKITVSDPAPQGNPAVAIANIDTGATTGTIAKGNVVKLVNP